MADPVEIKNYPNKKPEGVHCEWDFENHKLHVGWTIPVGATADNNDRRWTSVDLFFEVWTVPFSNQFKQPDVAKSFLESTAGDREGILMTPSYNVWVRGIGLDTSFEQGYDPQKFYPHSLYCMAHVYVYVIPRNHKDPGYRKEAKAPKAVVYAGIIPPPMPTLTVPEFDASANKLTTTLERAEKFPYETEFFADTSSQADWTQNEYRVVRTSSANGSSQQTVLDWNGTSEESLDIEVQVPDAQSIPPEQWVKVEFQAFSVGMGGSYARIAGWRNSGQGGRWIMLLNNLDNLTLASHVFAKPAAARITGISVSSMDYSSGLVAIGVDVRATEYSPVDYMKLLILKNSLAATPEAAAESEGWTEVATVNSGDIAGFTDTVANALPNRRRHVWYRVATFHDYEQNTRASTPVECTQLYRDDNILDDDDLRIVRCVSGNDGQSAKVDLAWEGHDWTGIEVTWSDKADAWESTEQPSSFELPWADPTTSSTTVVIRGLEEGTPYYVRARLFHDADDYRQYGGYASSETSWPVVPVTAATGVRLNAPSFVERGRDIPCSWTYQGEAVQTAWVLYRTGGTSVIVGQGNDAMGAYTVPAAMYGSAGSITLQASLTTGGEWGFSQEVTVGIADAPTLSLEEIGTLTENSLEVIATCSTSSFGLALAVKSMGATTELPDGQLDQPNGDVLWSAYVDAQASASEGGYEFTQQMPSLPFIDGCRYVVTATATDSFTGLSSETVSVEFGVDWAVKAGLAESVTVTPSRADLSCSIVAQYSGDAVYDLYRLTQDGAQLAGSDLEFGSRYVDLYAPASNEGPVGYRVCVRTGDGSLAWDDHAYAMKSPGLRLDWDGGSVTLPYNEEDEDSLEKDFELRRRMDGTFSAGWNEGVEVHGSSTTQLARDVQAAEMELVRSMAQHPGPVFVRTPGGSAYAADVQLGRIRRPGNSAARDVELSITRIPLSGSFSVSSGD